MNPRDHYEAADALDMRHLDLEEARPVQARANELIGQNDIPKLALLIQWSHDLVLGSEDQPPKKLNFTPAQVGELADELRHNKQFDAIAALALYTHQVDPAGGAALARERDAVRAAVTDLSFPGSFNAMARFARAGTTNLDLQYTVTRTLEDTARDRAEAGNYLELTRAAKLMHRVSVPYFEAIQTGAKDSGVYLTTPRSENDNVLAFMVAKNVVVGDGIRPASPHKVYAELAKKGRNTEALALDIVHEEHRRRLGFAPGSLAPPRY